MEEERDPMEVYYEALDQYNRDLDMYTLKKARYEKLLEEHSYLNFDLLVFVPEIQEEEAIKDRRYRKVTEDLRFVRTKTIVGKKDEDFVPFDFKYDQRLEKIKAKETKAKDSSFEKEGGDDENFGEEDEQE